ncbi:probable peptidyl-tRNA hydrolase 2 isoform X2 [Haliotis asinina]
MDEGESSTGASGSDAEFVPREDLIKSVMELGCSRNAAIKSLFYTGNYNAELAAAWLFENSDKNLDGPLEDDVESGSDSDVEFMSGGTLYKMVFVVNGELQMGVGKVAAQVAHACLGLFRKLIDEQIKYAEMLISWEQFGETKIVVKGENIAQLKELQAKAESLGLPNYTVQDAGRTQIAAGSTTVLAIIGKVDAVDQVSGKLKLL